MIRIGAPKEVAMRMRAGRVIRIVLLTLVAIPLTSLAGGAMKMAAVSFRLPKDDKPIALSGLTYGGYGGTVEVKTVRLEVKSKQGEDPVRIVWTFTGSNSKPQCRRVELKIFLIKGEKKRIASGRRKVLFKGVSSQQEFRLEMKVKAARWELTDRVYLQATFLSK